ncbi:hypothetical protein ACWD4O_10315 [Streptomyces sp. NPDC002623]
MTRTDRALSWAYLLASFLTLHCAVVSARHGAPWYTAGLTAATLLLIGATVREHQAADERRATAVKTERAARLRALDEQRAIRRTADTLGHSCCERWWTSCGTQHASTCNSQRRTV